MNEYSLDSLDSGLGGSSPLSVDYVSSDSFCTEMDEIPLNLNYSSRIIYKTRSYIEMPQTGEVNYIATITSVSGNPVYKGQGVWVHKSGKSTSTTVKVDKDDIRAKRHYVKTLNKDGRDIKIWECGLCGKEFRFQYTLVRHIPTHTDVRNYQCDICPKAFRQLSTLAQHKATHWNMRPFSCDFCSKSFNRISTLISHKKIHYDEKKHVCDYCGKGFHQKGNLRNHMYTHTNERPYKCDICGKGFNQKSNLVCHKISTHSKRDNQYCDICDITFAKQNLYLCHMESIHGLKNSANDVIKRHSSPSVWEDRGTTETQCAIIDEANNIVYSLPISVEQREKNTWNTSSNDPLKSTKDQALFSENELLAIVDQEPTSIILNSYRSNQVPFALYYANGELQPKICKVVLKDNGYLLKNPSNDDIRKYFTTKDTTNRKPTKFPIVATIFQKIDSYGCFQYLVIPAGVQSEITENIEDDILSDDMDGLNGKITLHSENSDQVVILPESSINMPVLPSHGDENEKPAVIYTKTQPKIRQFRGKSLDAIGNSKAKSEESLLSDCILVTPEIVESYSEKENNNTRLCIFIRQPDCNENESKVECVYGLEDSATENSYVVNDKQNQSINKISQTNTFSNAFTCQNNNLASKKSFGKNEFGTNSTCTYKTVASIKVCKQEKLLDTNIKQEDSSEMFLMDEHSSPYSELEATFLMNPENIKEPLSNLSFDEDNLDLLDTYSFNDSFLENATESVVQCPEHSDIFIIHTILWLFL